jgi:hypothetical protein
VSVDALYNLAFVVLGALGVIGFQAAWRARKKKFTGPITIHQRFEDIEPEHMFVTFKNSLSR